MTEQPNPYATEEDIADGDVVQAGVRRRSMLQAGAAIGGAAAAFHAATGRAAAEELGAVSAGARGTHAVPLIGDEDLTNGGDRLTTNQGVRVSSDSDSLKAGSRGPTLLEDFVLREKIMHFDHERVPERAVHARGTGAHGTFVLTKSLGKFTTAAVLTEVGAKTPVLVRFSTVNGSKGSADTVRDARGFATKFYTSQGNWDLVGNNIPVFFIQDAIKFPDLVHSFKPRPDIEVPQASTAHDSFWDFISLQPETLHMVMWAMSDRAIPCSFRMMDGFGVHSFRLLAGDGTATFVKFHWKAKLGVHSLVWDESHELTGRDPDFHRNDLSGAIAAGYHPQWDLAVQLLSERDASRLRFDVQDPTKLWPEEQVPLTVVGTMTLDRNPGNFFAEIEQAAFHPGHLVPGIDVSNDPLLQGRLFSYLDTQINRFNSANFAQLPVNAPRVPVNNFQQDGYMRYHARPGVANYSPNSVGDAPQVSAATDGGFVTYPEVMTGHKSRARSKTFDNHYSQARMFWLSMTGVERMHIIGAFQFELAKVQAVVIRKRVLTHLANIDPDLTRSVAGYLGLDAPKGSVDESMRPSPALSQERTPRSAATRKVAILITEGSKAGEVTAMQAKLSASKVMCEVVAPRLGTVSGVKVDHTYDTARAVQYDAVFVPGGKNVPDLTRNGAAMHLLEQMYKHFKPIATGGNAFDVLAAAVDIDKVGQEPGVIVGPSAADIAGKFIDAIAKARFWTRKGTQTVS